jgi:hypothetical protein
MAHAFRTTSHEAVSVLTWITPILIEMGNLAKCRHNARGNEHEGLCDAPKDYKKHKQSI